MQQSDILSLVEQLIPVYGAEDFELVLAQLTEEAPPSAKVLVKMELNRIMAPCSKSIDLRGRVQGECREYHLDGFTHWLDDVAINSYHRKIKQFGSYTEGVWEALVNTHNNFRVMRKKEKTENGNTHSEADSPFLVEAIKMGYTLKRQEKRLKMATLVEVTLQTGQNIHATSVDLSSSGAKFKVPTAFNYNLGGTLKAQFVQLAKHTKLTELSHPIEYRIIGVDDCYENNSIRWLRVLRLTKTDIIEKAIEALLTSTAKKTYHDNQDLILQARNHGFEYTSIKHTANLPLFFNGTELKFALLNEYNQSVWDYWHDERNQPMLGGLFSEKRMAELAQPGVKNTSNVLYSFIHEHKERLLHYSMLMPEASREERQLFWHAGARRESWKAFRLSVYELSPEEISHFLQAFSSQDDITIGDPNQNMLTHVCILQEIADAESRRDYLLTEKPSLDSSTLNRFRQSKKVTCSPRGIYYDAKSRRSEPRFMFKSPVEITAGDNTLQGHTVNFSSKGLFIKLEAPLIYKANAPAKISFKELQLYDKEAPLTDVPYTIIRISPNGLNIQLAIEDNNSTRQTVSFIKRLIAHNKEKLQASQEQLPPVELLTTMYGSILNRLVSTPYYVSKVSRLLRPVAVGVNYPLMSYLKVLDKLGHERNLSVEPVFKGRTNTLLAIPLRPISTPKVTYHEMYIAVVKKGEEIDVIHTRLLSDFKSLKERILFIKKAKLMGDFYALRISAVPVTSGITHILSEQLENLAAAAIHRARALEKEFSAIMGYGELTDITDEVLIRLELT
ncbi:PilZ domain-containing protein [Vibrio albus]|uniref:PilZ domain-containing protein n=1 Tax=Vibrio albus TaxID=2200953 RepID=A0A2U3BEP8_9VIBR|nr:PilZ domain-containing protein [Vibrio albus]PWI35243.1 PilZ domain-containing protein [Vibrio albus]